MSEAKSHEGRWSLVFWLIPTLGLVGYSAWCVADGWFRPGYPSQLFSQVMAPVALAVALWCLWQGIKEYRKVQAEEEQQERSSGGPPENGREE